jgi:hypothetical protein
VSDEEDERREPIRDLDGQWVELKGGPADGIMMQVAPPTHGIVVRRGDQLGVYELADRPFEDLDLAYMEWSTEVPPDLQRFMERRDRR